MSLMIDLAHQLSSAERQNLMMIMRLKRLMPKIKTLSNRFENRHHALVLNLLFCNCRCVRKDAWRDAAMAARVVERTLKMEDCIFIIEAEPVAALSPPRS